MSTDPRHFELPDPYRPLSITPTLIDVTLRDGGFTVEFDWPQEVSCALVEMLSRQGVEWVELGYLGGLPELHGVHGPGSHVDVSPDYVAALSHLPIKMAAMIHPSAEFDPGLLRKYRDAGLRMVRLVYAEAWHTKLTVVSRRARDEGLMVSVNIALASRYSVGALAQHAARIAGEAEPDIIYVADTCGALYPRQVVEMFDALHEVSAPQGIRLGFHAHDFLSLGLANALVAVEHGATFVDASVMGLGRGGGNLRLEDWLSATRPGPALRDLPDLIRTAQAARPKMPRRIESMLCGALNLTPPEEDLIRAYAAERQVDVAELLLCLRADRIADHLDAAALARLMERP